MYANEYGKQHFKHKTSFNDLVVFSDVLQNKIEDTVASTNLYIEKGAKDPDKWFLHLNNRLSVEYGDFFLNNNSPFGEINKLQYDSTEESIAFTQTYITNFSDGLIDYHQINEKFYIQLNTSIDLEEIIIISKNATK